MHAPTTDHTPDHVVGWFRALAFTADRRVMQPWITGGPAVACAAAIGAAAWGVVGVAIGITCAIAAVAAWVDVHESRLPDRLVALAASPVLGLLAWSAVQAEPGVIGQILLGAAVVACPLLVLHVASPAGLGFGDVKLGVVLGASLGLVDPRLGLVALCLGSGVTLFVALVLRRRSLPFGPGLVLGATCAFVIAGLIEMETVTW